jgi:hypothetical protein
LSALRASALDARIDSEALPQRYSETQTAQASNGTPPESQAHGAGQSVSATRQYSNAPIYFENTIDASKIDFILKNSVSPQRYSIETMTGGVAVFDYNNDGLLDIFFTNGAEIPSLKKSNPGFYNRLFRNNGDGTFTDVTEKAGLAGVGYSMGVAAGDYDNVVFFYFYLAAFKRNYLLHNIGKGIFSDVT